MDLCKEQLGRGGGVDGAVCSVQDYFENTVGTVQTNTVGKGGGRRQNASKHAPQKYLTFKRTSTANRVKKILGVIFYEKPAQKAAQRGNLHICSIRVFHIKSILGTLFKE